MIFIACLEFCPLLSSISRHSSFCGTVQIWCYVCVLSRSVVTQWTVAYQAPLSMGFSRQEYWSRLPFPPPGDLPNPGIEPTFLMSLVLAGGFFTTSATWEAHVLCYSDLRDSFGFSKNVSPWEKNSFISSYPVLKLFVSYCSG